MKKNRKKVHCKKGMKKIEENKYDENLFQRRSR